MQPPRRSYVYSIYGHLQQYSVRPSVGQFVNAGDWIAQVDNSGTSTGNHLHLQICLHPQADRVLATLDRGNTSRNPELWLQPFSYGTNTGTVVGRVSDDNGNAVGDLRIFGLSKPADAGGNDYLYYGNRTYAYTWAHPDDILGENWGTTDVTPWEYGYDLHAYYANGNYYRYLGRYPVRAGQITYVGLHPFYLPDIRWNDNGWNSSIIVRNNHTSRKAQVLITFFDSDGWAQSQRAETLNPQQVVTCTPSATVASGSAVVVGSEDISVVVVNDNDNNSKAYAYEGIPNPPSVSGIGAGTTIFVPSYMRDFYGWNSTVYAQNTGGASTIIYAYLYNGSGQQVGSAGSFVNPGGRASFGSLTGTNIGSVRVTTADPPQPLAVTAFHEYANEASAYACFAISGTVGYPVPLMKNFYGWYSSYVAQETTGQAVTVRADYCPSNNISHTFTLSALGQQTVWMGGESGLPSSWVGSAKAGATSGSGRMAMAVHSASSTGATAHPVAQAGARNLFAPYLRRGVDGWDTSLTVENVGTSSTGVTVYFYHMDGTSAGSYMFPSPLDRGCSRVVYSDLPPNATTSAWVCGAAENATLIAVVHQTHTSGRAIDYAMP